MNLPNFYDPNKVGELFIPDIPNAVAAGIDQKLPAFSEDSIRILLLLVDAQIDFIHTDGALSVPGAIEDTRRTVEWIYAHTQQLTHIAASLDSHTPNQIFFPPWWIDQQGGHPEPFTVITAKDVDEGKWRPVFEPEWSLKYVHELEESAKKQLMIWPFHTMMGTPGHNLSPSLYEAIAYHSAARKTKPTFVHKGMIAKTEFYSLLEPEVIVSDDPRGMINEKLLGEIFDFDAVYVAGQAKSHCVLETLSTIVREFSAKVGFKGKFRVLMDCTSSVYHPEIDFEAMAQDMYDRFREQGVELITSADLVT